jgi:hypothetical protein
MVTIHNLEVRFDVEGEGDEAAFRKLFERCIREWSRNCEEAQARERFLARERALGERRGEEHP